MIVADLPFEPFLNLLRTSAKNLNFHLIVILVAREADCRWAFKQLEKDWSSLHDITGNKIIIVTVDGKEYIPVSDNGNGLKKDIGTLRGNYGLVTFSRYCKLYNNVTDDYLKGRDISEWAQPIQEFARHIQPLPRSGEWRNSQSLSISSVLPTLGLSESQAPCLYIEIVHAQHRFVIPVADNPSNEFSFYKKFKRILLETDDSFKKIQGYSSWLHDDGDNPRIPRKVKEVANSLLWIKVWLESQNNLPEQVKLFILDALNGKAQNKDVYRIISLIDEIHPRIFSELRSHLDRITSLPELIHQADGISTSVSKKLLLEKILAESQFVEQTIQNIFAEEPVTTARIENLEIKSKNIQILAKEVYMESKYKITGGQQGSVGDNANAQHFNQTSNQNPQDVDLSLLAEQLSLLIAKLKDEAQDKKGDDATKYDTAIDTLSSAKVAAEQGDENNARSYLSVAGKWLLDIASKIGVPLVIELIKKEIGS